MYLFFLTIHATILLYYKLSRSKYINKSIYFLMLKSKYNLSHSHTGQLKQSKYNKNGTIFFACLLIGLLI